MTMKQVNTNDKHFLKIIDSTPLVSIDMILKNINGEVLLGKRINRPAQGYWFVPGGRIKKNERIRDAMKRISLNELGIDITMHDAKLLDVFDHIYEDNYLGVEGVNTHYVVLAYMVKVEENLEIIMDNQHSEINWRPIDLLLNSPDVHKNTKSYFMDKHKNG